MFKNHRAIYFSRIILGVATILLARNSNLRAQPVEIRLKAQFALWSTNVLDSTNWFSINGAKTEFIGVADEQSGCTPIITSPWQAIKGVPGQTYEVDWTGLYCGAAGRPEPISGFIFDDLPGCPQVSVGGFGSISGGWGFWPDECCLGNFTFTVGTNRGTVKFTDLCNGALPADGKTTTRPYLTEPSYFANGVTWSIEGDSLGCTLTNGPVILAGERAGTIKVRATDTTAGCYVEGKLKLGNTSCAGGACPAVSFGAGEVEANSVDVRIGLGSAANGESAGFLEIYEPAQNADLHRPVHLKYNFDIFNVDVVRDGAGNLRQIRVPQGLADIDPEYVQTTGYQVRFYRAADVGPRGVATYSVSGTPLTTWTISASSATSATDLTVVEAPAGGSSKTYTFSSPGSGTWSLTRPDGTSIEATDLGSGSSREQYVMSSNSDVVGYNYTLFNAATPRRPVEEYVGVGDVVLATLSSYYDNGLLQSITRPDNSWAHYFYDTQARPVTVFSSYMDETLTTNRTECRVTEYDYTPYASGDDGTLEPGTPRKTTESILGNVVSVGYTVVKPGEKQEITCVSGTNYNSAGNLTNKTTFYTSGLFYGEPKTVQRPDGTAEIYEYYEGVNRTNVVWSGLPGALLTNVTDGTKTITITGPVGQMISNVVIDAASIIAGTPVTISAESYSDYDELNRPQKITFLDGTWQYTKYASCCGEQTVTNREGTVTTFTYDDLKRLKSSAANGITNTFSYDAAGNRTSTVRSGSSGNSITTSSSTYDTAGRLATSTDGAGATTTFSDLLYLPSYPNPKTTTLPNGAERIEVYSRGGALLSLKGSGVHPSRYTNGFASDAGATRLFSAEIKLNSDGTDSSERSTNFYDLAGRVYKTAYSGTNGAASLFYYNSRGQLTNQTDPDGVATLFGYNGRGELEVTAIDMNRNGQIDFNGTDRITSTVRDVATIGGVNVIRTRTYQWATNSSAVSNLVSETRVSTDGLTTTQIALGMTNQTVISFSAGHKYVTATAADGSYTVSDYQNGRLLSSNRKDSAGGFLSQRTYTYDAHGRQSTIASVPTGTTTYGYDNADRVISITTPAPASGQSAQTTSALFDSMGNVATNILSDGASVISEYFLTGELKKKSGAREYPVEYAYDSQGRMKTMTTWQKYPSSGSAVTTWNYDPYRGFLTGKLYADSTGPTYSYTAGGRLKSRTWARGYTTTYNSDNAGAVTNITYSDPTGTPAITTTMDRLGRPSTVARGTNSILYTYNAAGAILSEYGSAGLLSSWSVNNVFDGLNRRVTNSFSWSGTVKGVVTNSYENASRLAFVSDGINNATYAYLTNSSLVSSIVFKSNTLVRLTTTKAYDNLYRLTQISNIPSADAAMTYNYAYNSANQRSGVTNADASFWAYGYDQLGQVTSGKKYFKDGVPVAGQQFEYAFDDMGNRKFAGEGGNEFGSGLRYQTYTVNNLNQYTQRNVPGAADVLGTANSNATVTVNMDPTYRHSDYFRAEPKLDNRTSPIFTNFATIGVLANGTNKDIVTTNSGNLLLPKNPETLVYDADGNLTTNGLWVLTWDAENQLVGLDSVSTVPSAVRQSLRFIYDFQGRRISKTVSNWNGTAWTFGYSTKFLYDSWNLLAELNATNNTVVRSYMWGSDASGTPQGAGGVGGLLAMHDFSGPIGAVGTNYFYGYDGNFNVRAVANGRDGKTSAEYDYDPFGNVLRTSGIFAQANSVRFSTKYQDQESGWNYYGYRYLANGAWLTRDPIWTSGGLNLYGFVDNNSPNLVDKDGRLVPILIAAAIAGAYFATEQYANAPGKGDRTYSGLTGDNVLSFVDLGVVLSAKLVQGLSKCLCKPICTRLVPGGGLAAHEAAGGHALGVHVPQQGATAAQVEQALATRLAQNANIPAASAFASRAVAENAVVEALEANQGTICSWLSGSVSRLVITHTSRSPVGIALARGAANATAAREVVVVLDKVAPQSGLCFRITTAYPK